MRWVITVVLVAILAAGAWFVGRHHRSFVPAVVELGPRLVSNQTAQPLALYGHGFTPGMHVALGAPFSRELPAVVWDDRHAYVVLPAGLDLPSSVPQQQVTLGLPGQPKPPELTVVNDLHFPDPLTFALSEDGSFALALSPTTDEGYLVDTASGKVTRVALGDGPLAVAALGPRHFLVGHQFAPELWELDAAHPEKPVRVLKSTNHVHGLVIDAAGNVAYLAEHAQDTVRAVDLKTGAELWLQHVMPNPAALALTPEGLAVGSLQAGTIEKLALEDGKVLARIAPRPGVEILGGHTEHFGDRVMGGKAVRALAWVDASRRLLVSSVGPNIGPNPDKMEVTMNGGLGVVDVAGAGKFERHVGMNAGVPEGLVVDAARGLTYAADIGLGVVRIYKTAALTGMAEAARGSLVGTIPLPVPAAFPRFRPDADLGKKGRAGPELYAGPRGLALSKDGKTLYVLDRFTGELVKVDVSELPEQSAHVVASWPLTRMLEESERRVGEVLYFTDLGRTAMSCDTCHLEGHTEGVLFEKTHPMRIYRSPTIRAARETPPYFTPASTFSIAQTMKVVGDRNRFHNPDLTPKEINDLTVFGAGYTLLPNPNLGPDGAPRETLSLPGGRQGHPRAGLALFEGKAQCQSCHPSPHFTLDQSPRTRGQYLDVGTPTLLPLREGMQDPGLSTFAPPSLLGGWDTFPMLNTGSAGLSVRADGSLDVTDPVALHAVLESYSGPKHGNAQALTQAERDDLLAYLLSL